MLLGALAGGLGCFPFDHRRYHRWSFSQDKYCGIRSLIGDGSRVDPTIHSVALPPQYNYLRHALEHFRGEPDISAFD